MDEAETRSATDSTTIEKNRPMRSFPMRFGATDSVSGITPAADSKTIPSDIAITNVAKYAENVLLARLSAMSSAGNNSAAADNIPTRITGMSIALPRSYNLDQRLR